MGKFVTRFWNEDDKKIYGDGCDPFSFLFFMPDKKAVKHTSNDTDFRIPEVNVLTK